MQLFRHLILTRFNVRLPEHRQRGADWLQHRCELFERFCLPSVIGQTCKNFDWVVFLDAATPMAFQERIRRYRDQGEFRRIYLNCEFTQRAVLDGIRHLTDGYEYLITTRLDNDDAICRNFVEVVQGRFASQRFEFLNFTNGYVWHADRVYRTRHLSNAFISLVERNGTYSTVFNGDHRYLSSLGPIRQIAEPAGWLQVVHDRNLGNAAHGTPCPIEEVRESFAIAPGCWGKTTT
ncbi:MAG TPA: glycosyltransferase [Bryobacteraceae bacterium]|jgi:hypothetical protein|nr:glycosyltransferase [Bryobacteraceae bacterium]